MGWQFRILLLASFAVMGAGFAALAQSDPVAIFRQAIDARNRGDIDGVMALFASDSVRQDGACTPACVGAAAVRRSVAQNIAEHFQARVLSVEGAGDTVTGQAEIRSDRFRAQGADFMMTSYVITFRDGKIVRWYSPPPASAAAKP